MAITVSFPLGCMKRALSMLCGDESWVYHISRYGRPTHHRSSINFGPEANSFNSSEVGVSAHILIARLLVLSS